MKMKLCYAVAVHASSQLKCCCVMLLLVGKEMKLLLSCCWLEKK
jgi:hypothetical protein